MSTNVPARIKIGISVYNDSKYLDLLLQSIRWYTLLQEPYDIVVCDDGSRQPYLDEVRALCMKYGATLIEHVDGDGNPRNQGIPATWNHLTNSLDGKAEIVVLLNNDIIVPPQWLTVAVHFLDKNKDNPHVGTCYWNPVNNVPYESMKSWLPALTHTFFDTFNVSNGQRRDFNSGGPMEVKIGDGQGLGRVMCPCGCCFAFRMDTYHLTTGFDERLTSFHEESDLGTQLAALGRASYGFAYPRPLHTHGAAFADNPELQGDERMVASRALYRQKYQVPDDVQDYFGHVNARYMSKIPKTPLYYLRPDYSRPPTKYTLSGGEQVEYPTLVEFHEEF